MTPPRQERSQLRLHQDRRGHSYDSTKTGEVTAMTPPRHVRSQLWLHQDRRGHSYDSTKTGEVTAMTPPRQTVMQLHTRGRSYDSTKTREVTAMTPPRHVKSQLGLHQDKHYLNIADHKWLCPSSLYFPPFCGSYAVWDSSSQAQSKIYGRVTENYGGPSGESSDNNR